MATRTASERHQAADCFRFATCTAMQLHHPAYFLTSHTYGSWLPGDERGWVEAGATVNSPDSRRE
jgi:hypothetical protein